MIAIDPNLYYKRGLYPSSDTTTSTVYFDVFIHSEDICYFGYSPTKKSLLLDWLEELRKLVGKLAFFLCVKEYRSVSPRRFRKANRIRDSPKSPPAANQFGLAAGG